MYFNAARTCGNSQQNGEDRPAWAQETRPGRMTLTLEGGETLTGKVLVGCDGRASGTARRAGITRTEWDYGQTALVCAIAHDKPHDGIAHQFFMPPGPLAMPAHQPLTAPWARHPG